MRGAKAMALHGSHHTIKTGLRGQRAQWLRMTRRLPSNIHDKSMLTPKPTVEAIESLRTESSQGEAQIWKCSWSLLAENSTKVRPICGTARREITGDFRCTSGP